MRVQLFIPCFVDQLFPQTAFNTIKVLEKAGCTVAYNPAQTCCGQPAFNAGFWAESRTVCAKFLEDFNTGDYIVSPSASCVGFVKNYYKKLFQDGTHRIDAAVAGRNVFELSQFLVNVLKKEDFGAALSGTATYHDSCASLRECGIKMESDAFCSLGF
jgi:L-lactate dehydrogenase complex protein LldE